MRRAQVFLAGIVLALALPSVASADVALGTTTQPGGTSASPCFPTGVIGQMSSASTPFVVPAGGGVITQWATNTLTDGAGDGMTFVVLRLRADGSYSVVAIDAQRLPNPLPASNVATFTPSTPIAVAGGDLLGLTGPSGDKCFWNSGTVLATSAVGLFAGSGAPTPGQQTFLGEAAAGNLANVAATLVVREDAGVTTAAAPTSVQLGNVVLLSSAVSNAGPSTSPITFTDNVPIGLTVSSASAGSGTCAVSGQLVTCTIAGPGAGQTVPVDVVVTPTAKKSYTNNVAVAPATGTSDPNAGNNTASSRFSVTAALVPPKCTVPSLARTPLSVARSVLGLLHCRVGKIKRAFSNSIANGAVIKTTPRRGSYSVGTKVTLQVSKGRKLRRKS